MLKCSDDSDMSLPSRTSDNRRGHWHIQERGASLAPMSVEEEEVEHGMQASGFGSQADGGIIRGEKQA